MYTMVTLSLVVTSIQNDSCKMVAEIIS